MPTKYFDVSKNISYPFLSFISSSNKPNELTQLIIDLSADPLKRFEIGKCGIEYAKNNFSFDVMGERLSTFMRGTGRIAVVIL